MVCATCCTACSSERDRHHSYFIHYEHDTLQNCVIHTNPRSSTCKWCTAEQWKEDDFLLKWYEWHVHWEVEREVGENEGGKNPTETVRSPNPQSYRESKQKWAREKIYSWLLLWAQWQNKLLWCVCCSVLTEKHRSYTTSTDKTRTGRNKEREIL